MYYLELLTTNKVILNIDIKMCDFTQVKHKRRDFQQKTGKCGQCLLFANLPILIIEIETSSKKMHNIELNIYILSRENHTIFYTETFRLSFSAA